MIDKLINLLLTFKDYLIFWVVVPENSAGIILRLGIICRVLSPGLYFKFPFIDYYWVNTTAIHTYRIYQSLPTKDGIITEVGLTALYRIVDIKKVFLSYNVDWQQSMDELMTFILQKIVLTSTFKELSKFEISDRLLNEATLHAEQYGIHFMKCAITDIKPHIIELIKMRFGTQIKKIVQRIEGF